MVVGLRKELVWLFSVLFFFSLLLLLPKAVMSQNRELDRCFAQWASYDGLRINKISFKTVLNLNYAELLSSITLRSGDVFCCQKLNDSINGLNERGLFALVQPSLKLSVDNQVELFFELTPRLVLAGSSFKGGLSLTEKKLERLATLRVGEPLEFDVIEKAKVRIMDGYAAAGFLGTDVKYSVEAVEPLPHVYVNWEINEGRRAVVKEVVFSGDHGDGVADIKQQIISYAVGHTASQSHLKQVRRRLLAALREIGYLQASVEATSSQNALEEKNYQVHVKITLREPIDIKFTGNNVFSHSELLSLLNFEKRIVPITLASLRSFCRDVEHRYQELGYYFTRVACSHSIGSNGRIEFLVKITESRHYHIQSITFIGNQIFSDARLRSVVASQQTANWPLSYWQQGVALREQLRADGKAIEALYQARGYLGTSVRRKVNGNKQSGEIAVVFAIDEKPLQLIKQVQLVWSEDLEQEKNRGITLVNFAAIDLKLAVDAGQPFDNDVLEAERRRVLGLLHAGGYPVAKVELRRDPEKGIVSYLVNPGRQITVSRVVLQGNYQTHDRVILDQLELGAGDLWNNERIAQSQQQLSALGFFRSVSVEPLDGNLDEDKEGLVVKVNERDTGTVDLGVNFATEDGMHLSAEVAERNFGGNGSAVVGAIDGYFKDGARAFDAGKVRLAYIRPNVLHTKSDWSLEAFLVSSVELVENYSYDRYGVSSNLFYQLFDKLKGKTGLVFYEENLSDVGSGMAIGSLDIGTHPYGVLQSSLDYDRRDDPYNPRSGGRVFFDGILVSEYLGAEADFGGLSLKQEYLMPLSNRLVWSNSVQMRWLEPLGDSDVIPLSSRIFLGGRNSLRGYSVAAIGPRADTGNIVGGDASLNLSTEFRYDLSDSLVGIFFLDAGQAMLDNQGEFSGESNNLDNLRFSPGFGAHYKTPIGPVRAEVGFATDREYGERWGRFNLGIGLAF